MEGRALVKDNTTLGPLCWRGIRHAIFSTARRNAGWVCALIWEWSFGVFICFVCLLVLFLAYCSFFWVYPYGGIGLFLGNEIWEAGGVNGRRETYMHICGIHMEFDPNFFHCHRADDTTEKFGIAGGVGKGGKQLSVFWWVLGGPSFFFLLPSYFFLNFFVGKRRRKKERKKKDPLAYTHHCTEYVTLLHSDAGP